MPKRVPWILVWLLTVTIIHCHGQATPPIPAYRLDAHDRIALKGEGGQVVVHRILPIDAAQRARWTNDPQSSSLQVRLVDSPEQVYEVSRKDVQRIEFFDDRLAAEAARLLQSNKHEEAFQSLLRLHRESPQHKDLRRLHGELLVKEASAAIAARQWEQAWVRLDEADRLSPDDTRVTNLLTQTLDQLTQGVWQKHNDRETQRWLSYLRTRYGARQEQLLATWQSRVDQQMDELTNTLESQMAARDLRGAQQTAQRLRPWRAQDPRIQATLQALKQQYPTVRVGITRGAASDSLPSDSTEWSTVRTARLLDRYLMEPGSLGTEGCRYGSPLGSVEQDDNLQRVRLVLAETEVPIAFWVSQAVLDQVRQHHPNGQTLRRLGLATSLTVEGALELELARPHLVPPGLFRMELSEAFRRAWGDEHPTPSRATPYTYESTSAVPTVYLANPDYLWRTEGQIQEIAEIPWSTSGGAVQALLNDELDVVERIHPADVSRLQNHPDVTVVPYAIPSIHVLVPNPKRPWMTDRTFRRGLLYLLPRQQILNDTLLAGSQVPGCRLVSGPLPAGQNVEDPLAYAYDETIAPYDFNPSAGRLLVEAGLNELARTTKQSWDLTELELRVAYFPGEMAEQACADICRRWSTSGIRAVAVRYDNAQALAAGEWDLWYRELALSEPLVDLPRLFGEGLGVASSAYVKLALTRAADATDWPTARQRLRELHRVLHEEVTLLPLWQVPEHAVHRRSLHGLRGPLMHLYQEIEAWRIENNGPDGGPTP